MLFDFRSTNANGENTPKLLLTNDGILTVINGNGIEVNTLDPFKELQIGKAFQCKDEGDGRVWRYNGQNKRNYYPILIVL